jgi:hypothetical protein
MARSANCGTKGAGNGGRCFVVAKKQIEDGAEQRLQDHKRRWETDLIIAREVAAEHAERAFQRALDGVQLTLDLAGFLPGVGAGPELLNALISATRGDRVGAALNLAAAAWGIGDAIKAKAMAAKAVAQGISHADEVMGVAGAVIKNGDEAAGLSSTVGRSLRDDHLFAKGLRKGLAEAADDAAEFWPELAQLLKETSELLADKNGPFAIVVQKGVSGADAHSKIFGEALTRFRSEVVALLEAVVDHGVDAAKKSNGPRFLEALENLLKQSLDSDAAKLADPKAISEGQRSLFQILKSFHDLFGV